MATLTYFTNIKEHILEYLNQAEHDMIVCVAWLTDEAILQTLVDKSQKQVYIWYIGE